MSLQRTPVNPWPWSVETGFNQGEIVEGQRRTLFCAGQTAMSAEGQPQHAGDMGAQVAMAVDNLEAVVRNAGMGLANVVRLNIHTTDVDLFFATTGGWPSGSQPRASRRPARCLASPASPSLTR